VDKEPPISPRIGRSLNVIISRVSAVSRCNGSKVPKVAAPARADRAAEEATVAAVEDVADPRTLLNHAECQETALMNAALINCWAPLSLRGIELKVVPAVVTLALVVFTLPTPLTANASGHTKGRTVQPFTSEFKPGDYVWHPEISPAGPVVIIVSLPEQRMYVYRNGVRIGRSTVSTGKPGKRTPTGVFTVLQKKVSHESSIYKGAQMPHMHRLTWSGIAMHAGQLPGYPASAGCVRMPVDFAEKLYAITRNGTSVIITDDKFAPGETSEPGRLLSGKTGAPGRRLVAGRYEWHPDKAPTGPLSIILSGPDQQAYVYRNGVEIGRAAVSTSGLDRGFGSHVYSALDKFDASGRREWISTASFGRTRAPDIKKLTNQVTIPPEFLERARAVVSPGTTLIVTDAPVSSQTHSGSGFNILTTN
jgi:lipoprotein-anchoring transpeptidase ErfK/SrfK